MNKSGKEIISVNRKYRNCKVRNKVILDKQEYFYVIILSTKWKARAFEEMFGYLIYFKINLIFKMKYMRLVKTFFIKIFDIRYLN